MSVKDLSLKKITASALLERLEQEGWSAHHDGLVQELVHRLSDKLDCFIDLNQCGDDTLSFTAQFPNIRLRTMNEVQGLLLGGSREIGDTITDFWKKYNNPSFLPFILTTSEASFVQAKDFLTNDRCLVLSSGQLRNLLNSSDPPETLKGYLKEQIPRRSLIPFDIFKPATGAMFFGRDEEISRLEEEDDVSFAVAGPGRMGKTSLVNRYRMQLAKSHNQRTARFPISFYKADPDADAAAQFFAMSVDPGSRSARIKPDGLVNLLRHMRSKHNKPIELLLDEVDDVCQGDAFRYLGEAAKLGHCRMVLCGKGVLLRTMLNNSSPFACRMELLQLGPLSETAARSLLFKPLSDLGFKFSNPDHVFDDIIPFTGRLPHLLQLFGRKFAEYAIRAGTNDITPTLLNDVKGDFLIPQFFIKSLIDLDDPTTRLLGLMLVEKAPDKISLADVQSAAEAEGLKLDVKHVFDICLDLTINNVLVWNHGSYRLANEGIRFYARQTDYLQTALTEARAAVNGAKQGQRPR
jgi:hypothetical protein